MEDHDPVAIPLPIELDLSRRMDRPASPYGQWGQCHYVGTDISSRTDCPACGASQVQGCGVWPTPELNELWDDIVFAWNNDRAEIAAVVSAMYFEGGVLKQWRVSCPR